jgi:microcystin-dependent protein
MSSTYSTNLTIELMGAGDQAGNWGSTTNTNLGTLLEQAIAGYTTYSCSGGTDTLTMTNGADATARNMYIQLNGTGGGTLVVPGTSPNANTKLYFIFNNTSSAITVKVSGQTGVSVPAAAKMLLVCNGTDIVQALNTFASPTFTGTPVAPTAATGTNTTQIATTAFVQSSGLVGEIKMWGVSSAPTGYLLCNGAAVSRTTYAALFAVYGTTFGSGDGATTFNVPDFRDRMPIGAGSTYSLAATGGAATTTIATTNLPAHNHGATSTSTSVVTDAGHSHVVGSRDSTADNGGGYAQEFVSAPNQANGPNTATSTVTTGITVATTTTTTTSNTGSGTALTTISPYLGIYYIIKT